MPETPAPAPPGASATGTHQQDQRVDRQLPHRHRTRATQPAARQVVGDSVEVRPRASRPRTFHALLELAGVDAPAGVGTGQPTRCTLTGLGGDQHERVRARPVDVVGGGLAERRGAGRRAEVVLHTPPHSRLVSRGRVHRDPAHGVEGEPTGTVELLCGQHKDLHRLGGRA